MGCSSSKEKFLDYPYDADGSNHTISVPKSSFGTNSASKHFIKTNPSSVEEDYFSADSYLNSSAFLKKTSSSTPAQQPKRLLGPTNVSTATDDTKQLQALDSITEQETAPEISQNFLDVYEKGIQLGAGGFATVFVGRNRLTGVEYAVKKVDRSKSVWNKRDSLDDEIDNLLLLREDKGSMKHIIILYETYRETKFCYLVMEYMRGGQLFDRLVAKRTYSEKEARDVCRDLLSAVEYMHSLRIAHRDLKPENLLLVDESNDTSIKVSDFGFSRRIEYNNQLRTLCGTPGYVAPEILHRWPAYDVPCDLWSVGVIMYELLGGCSPFGTDETKMIYERTRNADYKFHPANFESVSNSAKRLIAALLTINPDKRLTATTALQHEWFVTEDRLLRKNSLDAERLRLTIAAKKLTKVAVNVVKAVNRLGALKEDFQMYVDMKLELEEALRLPSILSVSGEPFQTFYSLGDVLGAGGFAIVYRTIRKRTDETYATKVVNIAEMKKITGGNHEKALSTLHDEIAALKLLRGGPHIVRLFDVFEEPENIHMVMEEMKGGDLLQRIVKKDVYTEREARKVCSCLFEALDYCHKKRIAHRDIKPENILLSDAESDTSIKIADFGFAKRVLRPYSLVTLCGTPSYVAPEILVAEAYDERVDNWSAGVILYVLLSGYKPFEGTTSELFDIIPTGSYQFTDEHWGHISVDAKHLVAALLKVDPEKRVSAGEVLQCAWMTAEEESLTVTDLSSAQERIKKSLPSDKLRVAVQAIIATNKFTSLGSGRARITQERLASVVEEENAQEKPFAQVYSIGEEVGTGSYSTVFKAVHRKTKQSYTVKRIDRTFLNPADAVAVQDEIDTLRMLRGCPNIVKMHQVFEEIDFGYVIMEQMTGGDLLTRISDKESYTERDARKIIANLLSGVNHCHKRRIANRNLQANNLFLVSTRSDTDIKITDFGFAKKLLYPNSLRTQCGTVGYVAPEILSHKPAYDVPCDMWSLGVILYLLLGGYRPFRGNTVDEMMELSRYGKYEFHQQYWSNISDMAKNLIRRMLTVDPKKRITAIQALGTEWIQTRTVSQRDLVSTRKQFQLMTAKRKLRATVNMIIAANKLQSLGRRQRAFSDF